MPNVTAILRDYARYFIGERYADSFAQGLLALERNWRGPLATNAGVYTTLQQFQDMERTAPPQTLANWRFQQALYRAYYDAYTRSRLLYETGLEDQAMLELRNARTLGADAAMNRAEAILDRAATDRVAEAWRARIFELAEALFQSIRMQLSVPRYKAIAVDRGANLDTIDYPLNNRLWLEAEIRRRSDALHRTRAPQRNRRHRPLDRSRPRRILRRSRQPHPAAAPGARPRLRERPGLSPVFAGRIRSPARHPHLLVDSCRIAPGGAPANAL